jgi:hypothetical protein
MLGEGEGTGEIATVKIGFVVLAVVFVTFVCFNASTTPPAIITAHNSATIAIGLIGRFAGLL